MNRIAKIAGGVVLAIGMASIGHAAPAAERLAAGDLVPADRITFYLADPELGVAGVFITGGQEIYFEARRSPEAKSGAPGALSLRLVDAEARTLALAGEPHAADWTSSMASFDSKSGAADGHLLARLGEALAAADLHPALAAEKATLSELAMQAAVTPARQLPLRTRVDASKSAAVDVADLADFYATKASGLRVKRTREGQLEARLGNGIVLKASQHFVHDEPDAYGQMGRIDAYSMVTDREGYVLAAELGGDLMPRDWDEALERESTREHHALAADFGRAATALNALAYSDRSAKGIALSEHAEQDAMQRLARTLASNLLPSRGDAAEAAGEGEALAKSTGRYQTYIQVWKKPFVVIAEHSGTRVGKWLYNSTTSSVRTHKGWVSFCNHGACAGASNMSQKCSYTGPRMGSYRLPSRRTDAGGHTCSTRYFATDLIGHHNCHDDSSVQVRAVRGQSYSITSGRCSDWVFWPRAPTCSAQ